MRQPSTTIQRTNIALHAPAGWLGMVLVAGCLAVSHAFAGVAATQPDAGGEAEQAFEKLYGARVRQVAASSPTKDDAELARELYEAARNSADAPALLRLLCDNAHVLGSRDAAGLGVAVDAMRLLAASRADLRRDALGRAVASATKRHSQTRGTDRDKAGEDLLTLQCELATVEEKAGDVRAALDSLRKASSLAGSIKSNKAPAVRATLAALSAKERAQVQAKKLATHLLANLGDKAAAAELVRLYVVELDQPQASADYLPLLTDKTWQTHAGLAAAPEGTLSPAHRLDLGDWYRELAESATTTKPLMLDRAKRHYQAFLDRQGAGGLEGKKASIALKDVEATLAKLNAPVEPKPGPNAEAGVELLKLLDIPSETVVGHSTPTGFGAWEWVGEKDKALRSPQREWARINFNFKLSGSYRLRLRFIREAAGGTIMVMLPVGEKVACLLLDGPRGRTGIELFDGEKLGDRNPTTTKGLLLPPNQEHVLDIEVLNRESDATIRAELNGRPLLAWSSTKMLLAANVWVTPANRLSVMPWMTRVEFRSIKLKVTQGQAEFPKRPTSATAVASYKASVEPQRRR